MLFIRRLLTGLSLLLITLGFFGVGQAAQPAADAPIIARVGTQLFAVSPTSGEALLLDEVSVELDELFRENYAGSGIQLDSISPDNVYVAYTVASDSLLVGEDANRQKALAGRASNAVVILNIASRERKLVMSQPDTGNVVQHYRDLTWSLDGKRLYFVMEARPLDNQPQTRSLYYYDMDAGTTHEVGDVLRPPVTADNQLIGVYPLTGTVAVLHAVGSNGQFRFIVFGEDDRLINQYDMQLAGAQDVNAWMFTYNPIHLLDNFMFGYFTFDSSGPLPNALDIPANRSEAVDPAAHLTIVSHAAPSASLRLVLDSTFVGDVPWVLADREGNTVMSLDTVVYEMDAAVAPDGLAIAYLDERGKTGEPRAILIHDGSEPRWLGFAANDILWGAAEYSFTS